MPHLAVVAMDDVVLAPAPAGSYAASVPIPEGMALAHLLMEAGPVAFLTSADEEKASYWLKVNRLGEGRVIAPDPRDGDQSPAGVQRRQIARLRATGPLWLVVTASPQVGLWCYESGQAAMVFLQPTYRSSEPATEIPDWATLAAATMRARELEGQRAELGDDDPV